MEGRKDVGKEGRKEGRKEGIQISLQPTEEPICAMAVIAMTYSDSGP